MLTTLALSDSWTIGLTVLSLTVNAIVGLGLWLLSNSVAKLKDARSEIKSQSDKALSESLNGLRSEINSVRVEMKEAIHRVEERLGDGDETFESLKAKREGDQLRLMTAIAEIREMIAGQYVRRAECDQHHQRVEHRVTSLEHRVSAIEARN
jgi:DNA-binding HxlR family transcriptional regulator